MRHLVLGILLFSTVLASGQNARTFMKAAEQYIENGFYEDAIEQYNQAIAVEPENGKAFEERAKSYEALNKLGEAANDYKNAAVFNSNPAANYLHAAELYFQLKEYSLAVTHARKAAETDQKLQDAYILETKALIQLNKYTEAQKAAANALNVKNTAYAQYLKGLVEFKLGNNEQAEQDLEKAIIKDKNLFDAFLTLAELQFNNNKIKYSIENSSYVIVNDKRNAQAYELRSRAFAKQGQYPKAIQDISTAITLDTANANYLVLRGGYYLDFSQFQNAINDYTVALSSDMLNQKALLQRAIAYEKIGQQAKAVSDYKLLQTLYDESESEQTAYIEEKIFELNREESKPLIQLANPTLNDKLEVLISSDLQSVEIIADIEDESNLKFFKINNDTLLNIPTGTGKKEFRYLVNADELEFITLSAVDIYDNSTTVSYAVERIETHKPEIKLLNPYAGDDQIITLTPDDNYLYLEGRIEDESLISSIRIDEMTASYAPRDLNPRFTATLDVQKKNRIFIEVTDIYGNVTEKEYHFKRDGRVLSNSDTPMGKTWVVLIENSEYAEFANLQSPEQDLQTMQHALSRYKVNKVIVKSNLTKREMERFFSIDLRDLIRVNQVNSLLIWFAGHGANKNGTGYWIPSDAKMDVEFTYFNINALKASLYSYSSLTHLLVVSDACETGPAFCEALRGPIEEVSCSQTQLALKQSAQVLTSAGEGYAYDNSLFTRAFANTLLNNDDDCVTIDDIAQRVTKVLQTSTAQKPEFGRIKGIQDEMGTFFFMTR